MTKLTWTLWIVMLALVVSGEVLPGTSPPMRWVSSTGISDKVLHYGAYTLLAGIPTIGFPPEELGDQTYIKMLLREGLDRQERVRRRA